MNLFRLIKLSRELSRMEKKAKANPSPSTFVDLAQVYINLGWHAHTMRVAEEGLLLFPRSEELRKVHRLASDKLLKERLDDLQHKLATSPSAKLYRDLAQIYFDRDPEGVVRTCEEGLRRYPEDVELRLVLGQQHVRHYYKTLAVGDGREALGCLHKILEIDQGHVEAHKALAELYYRIGAVRHAREHADFLYQRYPEDADIKSLVRALAAATGEHDEPERLFASVQRKGTLANRSLSEERREAAAAAEDAIESIRDGLSRIVQIEGVRKAAYIRGSKALVKGDIHDGRDPFLKTVRVVAKASQRAVRRMDLGNFNGGVVDCKFGHICVCCLGDVCAAVECERGSVVDRIADELQELVTGSLYASGRRKT